MDRDLITLNEVLNDGSHLFLYPEEKMGIWVSYGYSAYMLSQISEIKTLSSFSDLMQMPCTCISETEFRSIAQRYISTIERRDEYYTLPTNSKVEDDAYKQWVSSLK